MEDWEYFEHASILHHANKYGHTTWHWSRVPEKALYDAGYIHTYNEIRMRRIAELKKDSEYNPFRDIGFDGLACETINGQQIYHGLQAKCYTRNLGGGDIGTFLGKYFLLHLQNKLSRGYLYHAKDLTIFLKEDLKRFKDGGMHIIAERLPIIEENGGIKNDPLIFPTSEYDETGYILTASQELNLKDLLANSTGKRLLHRPCGTGKTIVAGNLLRKESPNNRVVIIAPLRISVDNLYRRLPVFLPRHEILLVDSDYGGITCKDHIKKFAKKSRWAIFTTFKSAREILATMPEIKYDYVVVDEVHNIMRVGILSKFINGIPRGSCMTATPPSDMDKIIDISHTVSYSLVDAIADKAVCDYRVWIPLLIKNGDVSEDSEEDTEKMEYNIDMPIPSEFIDLPKKPVSQSMFLSNGMFQTGVRKCIGYFRTIDECKDFKEVFEKVMLKYHGLKCRIDLINQATTKARRNKILAAFDDPKNMGIHLILSVRVLDEAVDLKQCDSEFISYTGDSVRDIRTVQRMMRGCRIDPNNPAKINNLFIWANVNDDKALRVFSLLKSMDPQFSGKIHTISSNYDKQNTTEVKEKVAAQDGDCNNYVIKCMNLNECRIYKGKLTLEYAEIHYTHPPCKCRYKGFEIGIYWNSIKHGHNKDIYESMLRHNDKLRTNYEKCQELKATNAEQPKKTSIQMGYELLEYMATHDKPPISKSKLGIFWSNIKQGHNRNIYESMLRHNDKLRTNYEKCQTLKAIKAERSKKTPMEMGHELLAYMKTHDKPPHVNKSALGLFWNSIKQGSNKIVYETLLKFNEKLCTDYDKTQALKLERANQPKKSPTDKGHELLEYVRINESCPPATRHALSAFWRRIKDGQHKRIYETMLKSNDILRNNYEKAQIDRAEKKAKPKVTGDMIAKLILKYVGINERHPSRDCRYEGVDIGNYWNRICYRGHNQKIYEKYLSHNPILRAVYERTAPMRQKE